MVQGASVSEDAHGTQRDACEREQEQMGLGIFGESPSSSL